MFPGRQPGVRTLQGLTASAGLAKLGAAAEQERDRHREAAARSGRAKALQNLATAIILTIIATVTVVFAMDRATGLLRWAVPGLAFTATICNLVIVTRRDPERQTAHFHMAKRYGAFVASCRVCIAKYDEKRVGDTELQSLLDQHLSDMAALKEDTARTFAI